VCILNSSYVAFILTFLVLFMFHFANKYICGMSMEGLYPDSARFVK